MKVSNYQSASAAPRGPRPAAWIRDRNRSPLRELVAVASRPGVLSLAGGLPDPLLFPRREYGDALQSVLANDPAALQYGPPFEPLKARIVELMARRGVSSTVEEIFVTTGAQQAIDVLTRLLLDPGGEVLLEDVTYAGIQQAIGPFQPDVLTVGTDLRSGIDVERVEHLLESGARPAFIYVVADAHNPLGVSLSLERRLRLVELARRFRVPIVEDDPYGFLQYDSSRQPETAGARSLPPLRALDDDWVIYVGSFSKILAPALRLGWAVLPTELIARATIVKEASDLESSSLTQRAVSRFLEEGRLSLHLDRLRATYRSRRDAMLDALERHFPSSATWTRPQGGLFVWVELGDPVDATELLTEAIRDEHVAFVPGAAFSVSGHGAGNCMRLSFSTCSEAAIREGVRRLGRLVGRPRSVPGVGGGVGKEGAA